MNKPVGNSHKALGRYSNNIIEPVSLYSSILIMSVIKIQPSLNLLQAVTLLITGPV